MKKNLTIFIFSLVTISQTFAADVKAIERLFKENYDSFYQPRYCGKNTQRLVSEAHKRKINLSNSYVMKIVGGGFWETSGFYTRNNINERAMLGYFHMVFVADGYVFDFDLDDPIVVKLEEYFRLQFIPPSASDFYGGEARTISELKGWTITRYEWADYIKNIEKPTWVKKLHEIMNVEKIVQGKRVR